MLAALTYKEEVVEEGLTLCDKAILKALLYFDVFHFPLHIDDVCRYAPRATSNERVIERLNKLIEWGYIKGNGAFYCLATRDAVGYAERRIEGGRKADKLLKTARKFSKFISYFPFVRSICLSGSLSKGYADKDSDIDYFIITKPGRLWLCRTILVLFKKLFLFNSHKYFCVNYFVDTSSLEITDKNLFTATELSSVIPTYNGQLYEELMAANVWRWQYLPNTVNRNIDSVLQENNSAIKRGIEWIFSGRMGEWLEERSFRMTLKQWKKKFKDFDEEEFDLRLRSRKNVSKHHPNGFQEKVMKKYDENKTEFEQRFGITLD